MEIRNTQLQDLNNILGVYKYAREQMKLSGNPHQWYDKYPTEEKIVDDIKNANSYVIENCGTLCGVFTFIIGEEPTYQKIEGQWKNDKPYGTIHRLASSGAESGIFNQCLKFCQSKISNIRIDTHRDNKIMQHLIEKNGFERCGIIYVADGSPRIAYQKILI